MTTPAPQPAAPQPAAPLTEAEDKQWASFAHFGGILGLLPSLIIFLVFKDRGAKTNVEAKEALNWQITWIAASIILAILTGIIGGILWGDRVVRRDHASRLRRHRRGRAVVSRSARAHRRGCSTSPT